MGNQGLQLGVATGKSDIDYAIGKTNSMTNLMKYVLWYAKEGIADLKFDCFNCLFTGEDFVTDLEFQSGDGILNYYLFNYQLKDDL